VGTGMMEQGSHLLVAWIKIKGQNFCDLQTKYAMIQD
jgi:hypothetical protein